MKGNFVQNLIFFTSVCFVSENLGAEWGDLKQSGVRIIPVETRSVGRVPLASDQCTAKDDVPVIRLKSYQVELPLEDDQKNIVFSGFNMMRRLLRSEKKKKNVTVKYPDICLGEGGLQEWEVPRPNRTHFVSEFVIECYDQGLGPVEWEYSGVGDFSVTHGDVGLSESIEENDSVRHIHMPTAYKMVFKNFSDQIVGNYTCRSTDYPEKMNTFHLYAPSQGRPYLVQRGKSINVTSSDQDPLVTLPCISNSPDAKIYLFKKFVMNRLGLIISKYQLQPFHIYDPKKGFIIDTSYRTVDPFGVYICSSSLNIRDATDRIKINLFPPQSFSRKVGQYPRMSLFSLGHRVVHDSINRMRHLLGSLFL